MVVLVPKFSFVSAHITVFLVAGLLVSPRLFKRNSLYNTYCVSPPSPDPDVASAEVWRLNNSITSALKGMMRLFAYRSPGHEVKHPAS